jgi:hypothetical protein
VSVETVPAKGAKAAEKPAKAQAPVEDVVEEPEAPAGEVEEIEAPVEEIDEPVEAVAEEPTEAVAEELQEPEAEEAQAKPQKASAKATPGFSKLFDSLAGLTGFHAQSVKVEPVLPEMTAEEQVPDDIVEPEPAEDVAAEEPQAEEPEAEEPVEAELESPEPETEDEPVVARQAEPAKPVEKAEQPSSKAEGPLQDKLTEVRARADEARLAKLRANAALYEGLSAAYDFALDAEEAPEEYLRLVEAQGLKIQLRSPMKPVVKLAFDGMCDDATIKQLEAVLAWAFDQELPRGALAGEIEAAGGIGRVLNGEAKAA